MALDHGRVTNGLPSTYQKGNPFLSLRAIPFLIVLATSLTIQPAVRANPVVKTIPVTTPVFFLGGIVASPNRSEVYVADGANNRIAVIDTARESDRFFYTHG
jgi:hypothetical protein